MNPTTARRLLTGALSFGAISALIGGVLGVVANGAGMPLEYLTGTPFTSYLGPGLILGLVIGGTQGLAAVMTQRGHPYSRLAASVAGFGMIIWIFGELAVINEYSWLQTLYLALGVGELVLVLILSGVLPAVARVPSER